MTAAIDMNRTDASDRSRATLRSPGLGQYRNNIFVVGCNGADCLKIVVRYANKTAHQRLKTGLRLA